MKPDSKLRLLRQQRGLTIDEVAHCVPCDKATVSQWERGVKEPSPNYRKGYAKALRISLSKLGMLVYEVTER